MSFKVGDKVRILDGSKINDYFGSWVDSMKEHVGKVCTIDEVHRDGGATGYHMKSIGYMWDERGLELAEQKFKVGDKVIAKKNNGYGITTDGWTGVVTKITDYGFNAKGPGFNGRSHNFRDLRYDGFDLVKEEEKKIVITHNGKTTTAKLFEGDECIKTAKARCCPSDKFDFGIGASIALERLTGNIYGHLESTLDSDLQWNSFIAGKIALKVPVEKSEKFLKECDEHGLKWSNGKRATTWNPVKEANFIFDHVYMYHHDDCLSYSDEDVGDYMLEVWEDDSFDWDKFKAGKFNVVVTRDSIDRFLEECDAHEIIYADGMRATDFNPIKDISALSPFGKAMLQMIFNVDSPDECDFEVEDGALLYSFKPEIKESTVKYD